MAINIIELGELERRLIDRTAQLEATNRKLQHEISERKQAEQETRLLLTITQTISSARDFKSALQTTLEKVCEATGWDIGEVWVPSRDGIVLEGVCAAYGNVPQLEAFRKASELTTYAPGIGVPGRVWVSKSPMWIPDVSVLGPPFSARRQVALEIGLKVALAIPIVTNDRVLAVLTFFMFKSRDEDKRLVEMISAIALQLGSVIQHKQAEEALRESEARLTLAQEAADIGTGDWDVKSDNVYWSDRQFHLHGMAPTEDNMISIGDWLALIHPEDRERSVNIVNATVKSGEGFSTEYRVVRPDGQIRWLRGTARVIRDDNGRALRMIGVSNDITEPKQAEHGLKERTERLEGLIRTSAKVAATINTTETLDAIAEEAANLLKVEGAGFRLLEKDRLVVAGTYGLARNIMLTPSIEMGQSLTGLIAQEGRAIAVPDLRQERRFYEQHRKAATTEGVVAFLGVPLRYHNRIIGVLNVYGKERHTFPETEISLLQAFADQAAIAIERTRLYDGVKQQAEELQIEITERKRAEAALRESEERFALAAQGANDGLWYRPDVSKDGEWWSPRWYELLGYEEHELEASRSSFEALLYPDDLASNKELMNAHLEKQTPYDTEYRLKTKSGEYRWYRCRAQAVWDEYGNPTKMAGSIRDITTRKQTQDALKSSEERFALAAQGSQDAIWDWPDVNADDEWWSARWYELTGYREGELKPGRSTFLALVHPDDLSREKEHLRQHLEEHKPYDLEYRLRTKSGEYRWYQSRGQAIWDKDGNPTRVAGSFRDITDRKLAEEALARFEHMVSASSDLMAFIDKTHTYLAANTAYIEALGKTKEKVIGNRVQNVLGDKVFDSRIKPSLNQCLSGKSINYQLWLNLPPHGTRYLDVRYDPYRDSNNSVSGVVISIRDITENKRAEEALRESEMRYRSIVEHAPICIYEMDRNGRLISMNPAGLRMMRVESQADIVGFPYLEVVCTNERPRVKRLLKRALAGEPAAFDFNSTTKLGKRAFTSSFNPIRTADGATEKLMGMTEDITERKRAEDQILVSHQRLRNLATQLQAVREEERTIIAREVHDELGQALTALKMDLVWVVKNLPNELKVVPNRVQSMISLTDSTLSTVRQLSSRLRPAMLDDLGLEAAIEWQLQDFTSRGNYECQVDFRASALKPNKKRDTAIFRIFQEALTNIARHANASRIDVRLQDKHDELLLMIRDDGKGISDDALSSAYSLGLTGMYERARTLGGNLKIGRDARTGGTILRLRVPIISAQSLVDA